VTKKLLAAAAVSLCAPITLAAEQLNDDIYEYDESSGFSMDFNALYSFNSIKGSNNEETQDSTSGFGYGVSLNYDWNLHSSFTLGMTTGFNFYANKYIGTGEYESKSMYSIYSTNVTADINVHSSAFILGLKPTVHFLGDKINVGTLIGYSYNTTSRYAEKAQHKPLNLKKSYAGHGVITGLEVNYRFHPMWAFGLGYQYNFAAMGVRTGSYQAIYSSIKLSI
jgi:hypothetical protein